VAASEFNDLRLGAVRAGDPPWRPISVARESSVRLAVLLLGCNVLRESAQATMDEPTPPWFHRGRWVHVRSSPRHEHSLGSASRPQSISACWCVGIGSRVCVDRRLCPRGPMAHWPGKRTVHARHGASECRDLHRTICGRCANRIYGITVLRRTSAQSHARTFRPRRVDRSPQQSTRRLAHQTRRDTGSIPCREAQATPPPAQVVD
jgi:hypothetical protein